MLLTADDIDDVYAKFDRKDSATRKRTQVAKSERMILDPRQPRKFKRDR